MIQPKNPLEESLSKLDLKGLLVLNGIITQQALKLILDSENSISSLMKPDTAIKLPSILRNNNGR